MCTEIGEAQPVLSKKRSLVHATRAGRDRMAGATRRARAASGPPGPNAARARGGSADGWSRPCSRSVFPIVVSVRLFMFSSSLLQAYSGASIWELMLRRRHTMLLGNRYMNMLLSFLRTFTQQHIEFVTTVVSSRSLRTGMPVI